MNYTFGKQIIDYGCIQINQTTTRLKCLAVTQDHENCFTCSKIVFY